MLESPLTSVLKEFLNIFFAKPKKLEKNECPKEGGCCKVSFLYTFDEILLRYR